MLSVVANARAPTASAGNAKSCTVTAAKTTLKIVKKTRLDGIRTAGSVNQHSSQVNLAARGAGLLPDDAATDAVLLLPCSVWLRGATWVGPPSAVGRRTWAAPSVVTNARAPTASAGSAKRCAAKMAKATPQIVKKIRLDSKRTADSLNKHSNDADLVASVLRRVPNGAAMDAVDAGATKDAALSGPRGAWFGSVCWARGLNSAAMLGPRARAAPSVTVNASAPTAAAGRANCSAAAAATATPPMALPTDATREEAEGVGKARNGDQSSSGTFLSTTPVAAPTSAVFGTCWAACVCAAAVGALAFGCAAPLVVGGTCVEDGARLSPPASLWASVLATM
mmetsp:Transcript_77455/g.199384  ORF Transcript_77455/g.199384 Transcript_77455/m.199384 type:complete len:338 (-) Transcript_77455:549-1562(-)